MYRLENSSATSENHHSSLTSTSYRKTKDTKKNWIKTKANMKLDKDSKLMRKGEQNNIK